MSIDLGERIKNLRIKKGYTQTKLASLTGIENVTLSKYENGQQEPGVQNLIRLSDELETSIDYIVRGDKNNLYFRDYKQNKSEGYKVAKEIVDLYNLRLIDIDDFGQMYIYDQYGIRDFLSTYRSLMNDENKDDPGYDKFLETKIKNFAKKYDNWKSEEINNLLD